MRASPQLAQGLFSIMPDSKPPTTREKLVRKITEKYNQGQLPTEIAKDLGLSRAFTSKVIRNLPPPHTL